MQEEITAEEIMMVLIKLWAHQEHRELISVRIYKKDDQSECPEKKEV